MNRVMRNNVVHIKLCLVLIVFAYVLLFWIYDLEVYSTYTFYIVFCEMFTYDVGFGSVYFLGSMKILSDVFVYCIRLLELL